MFGGQEFEAYTFSLPSITFMCKCERGINNSTTNLLTLILCAHGVQSQKLQPIFLGLVQS